MWELARGPEAHSGDEALLVTGSCYPGHRPELAATDRPPSTRGVWGGPGIRVQSLGTLTSPVRPVCVGHTSKEEISRDTEEPTAWAVRDWLGDGPPLARSPANHSSGPVDGLLHPSSAVSLILTALLSSRTITTSVSQTGTRRHEEAQELPLGHSANKRQSWNRTSAT